MRCLKHGVTINDGHCLECDKNGQAGKEKVLSDLVDQQIEKRVW